MLPKPLKKSRQLELVVLKQGAEHQQIALSFKLEGVKESEMNAKCKQHSLSAGALLLASKPSIKVVLFLTVLETSPSTSLLYNNNTD